MCLFKFIQNILQAKKGLPSRFQKSFFDTIYRMPAISKCNFLNSRKCLFLTLNHLYVSHDTLIHIKSSVRLSGSIFVSVKALKHRATRTSDLMSRKAFF
eukprot:UN07441